MSELSELINRIWISKNDLDFYDVKSYVRRNREELSSLMERFGWYISVEPNLIHLKKNNLTDCLVRNQGIPSFKTKEDYLNLMMILMYMSQPSHSLIFTLEEMIDYMKFLQREEEIEEDFSSRQFTYSLYRTLSYMESIHLLQRMDGRLNDLLDHVSRTPGILYKNTGLYHNFITRNRREEEPTILQKLYQTLFAQTLVSINEKEYQLLKNHQEQIEDDFRLITDEEVELVFHKNYAYINHKEGNHFPNENNRKDWMILRVCRKLQESGKTIISKAYLSKILDEVRKEDSLYWTQEMVKWGKHSYEKYAMTQLIHKNMIEELDGSFLIHPAIAHMNL